MRKLYAIFIFWCVLVLYILRRRIITWIARRYVQTIVPQTESTFLLNSGEAARRRLYKMYQKELNEASNLASQARGAILRYRQDISVSLSPPYVNSLSSIEQIEAGLQSLWAQRAIWKELVSIAKGRYEEEEQAWLEKTTPSRRDPEPDTSSLEGA